MALPLVGAALAAARVAAKKFGKKTEEPRERFKSSYDKAKEAEDKIKAAAEKKEKIKEEIKTAAKTAAKTTAKATGAAGGAGVMYLTAEDMATSGQGGPATEALSKLSREAFKENDEPIKKKAGGMIKSSASKRADGIAMKGKTKGRIV